MFISTFYIFFFLLIRPPPTSTLFPYTTLFRSPSHSLIDFSRVEAIAVPFSRLASRGRQPQISPGWERIIVRSEEHTSELQSRFDLVCRLLLEKKKKK